MNVVRFPGPWLAIGERAERALLNAGAFRSSEEARRSPSDSWNESLEAGSLRAAGARLDAVQRPHSPYVIRVADAFVALGWLARDSAHGCLVAAETIADRPLEALQALRVRLKEAPMFLLDAEALPAVRSAAQQADVALFSETRAPVLAGPDSKANTPLSDVPEPSFADGCLEYLADPEAMARFVVDALRERTGARRITLMLRDPERPALSLEAGEGLQEALVGTVRSPLGRGIAGRVATLGRPIIGRGSSGGARNYPGSTYAVLPG